MTDIPDAGNASDPSSFQGWPMNAPMDIRPGMTRLDDIHHPLRWGVLSAPAIASDWVKSLRDEPGEWVTAVATRDQAR